jgi:4-amino-4-deoxy-L-arabinose transferase-like glycosyltransferase
MWARLFTAAGRAAELRYLLLLLLLSAAVRSPTLFSYNFNVDEAIYSAIAAEVLDGQLYYRDAVDHKPPGVYYIYAAIYAAAGRYNLVAIHLALFLTVALTGWLLARIGARLFGASTVSFPLGRLAGVLYVGVGAIGPPMDFQAANAELFMNLPLVAGVLCALRARETGSGLAELGTGLLLGLAGLIKLQALFIAPALLLYLLQTPGRRARPLLLGTLGIALPYAAHVLVYWRLDALGDLMWALRFNRLYVGAVDTVTHAGRALQRGAIFLGLDLAIIAPALAYVLHDRGARSTPARARWALLAGWLALAIGAVSVGGRYFLHYFIQLTPPLALLAAPKLSAWTARRRLVGTAAAALIVLGVVGSISASLLDRRLRPHEAWHQDGYRAVGDYVQRHTRESDRIFVWGDSAAIYLYARRRMGTRYLWVNYQLGRIWGTPYDEVDAPQRPELASPETWPLLLDDLRRRRPELIIDAGAGQLDEFDRHPLTRYPQMEHVVGARYRLEAIVRGVPIYRRVR